MRPKIMSDFRLLELATEVIMEHGPEAFTLRRIAKHAKVSPATLIKRFESRDKLLNKCISQHISKIIEHKPDKLTKLEAFINGQSKNHTQDNFIQNMSMLARDMREPALRKIAKKYFESFRSSLLAVIENDERFINIKDKEEFVFQIEAIFQGAIIQGAFLNNKSINQNIEDRISEYVLHKCNFSLKWF